MTLIDMTEDDVRREIERIRDEAKLPLVERWKRFPAHLRLALLGLWGMRPGWQPPEHVLVAYGVSYTQVSAWPPKKADAP